MSKRKAKTNTDNDSDKENQIVFEKQPKRSTRTQPSTSPSTTTISVESNTSQDATNPKPEIAQIRDLLNSVKSTSKCSVSGTATELPPDPELTIKNHGKLILPLNKISADSLIKICEPSPYGRKTETLYNKAVRDSYQLEPKQIQIKNAKAWNDGLQKLAQRVCHEMGCQSKVNAHLYKMLVYKQGSHFKKHKDTEKHAGMFATLIVQLPSVYTGGQLIVYDNQGRAQTHTLAQDGISYAAHYADLEHEVAELKSGHRVALIYNLCCAERELNESAYNVSSGLMDDMRQALAGLSESACPMAVFFEHHYTQDSFLMNGVNALKGVDKERFVLIKKANDLLGTERKSRFFLVQAALEVIDGDMLAGCYGALSCAESEIAEEDKVEYDGPGPKSKRWDECNADPRIRKFFGLDGMPCFSEHETYFDFSMFNAVIEPNSGSIFDFKQAQVFRILFFFEIRREKFGF
jgi:predicted 2-oxoglutarate/Fe(II)-dependent dioxygenase YbiX